MQKNPVDLVDEVSLLLCILLKPMKPLPQTILTCHWTPTGTTIDFHPGSLITVRIYTNFISCDAAKCHILEGEVGPSPRISQNRRDWQLNCVFFQIFFNFVIRELSDVLSAKKNTNKSVADLRGGAGLIPLTPNFEAQILPLPQLCCIMSAKSRVSPPPPYTNPRSAPVSRATEWKDAHNFYPFSSSFYSPFKPLYSSKHISNFYILKTAEMWIDAESKTLLLYLERQIPNQ